MSEEQKSKYLQAIIKAVNYGTLPVPNPYGKTVKVERHNQVVKEMEQILLEAVEDSK